MSSVYKNVHALLHANVHELTIHTQVMHNGITKQEQTEATVRNVN